MPEFYSGTGSRYQPNAQPYLDAIARAIRDDETVRGWLLAGTEWAQEFDGSQPLWQEQWRCRDPGNSNKQPFWANYWSEPCAGCNCRIDNSVSMEIDAMFFFQNAKARILALHLEMKLDRKLLSHGQAEAYRPRAECYRTGRKLRKTVNRHDEAMTVLVCGLGTDLTMARQHFDRVIRHVEARRMITGYPL